MEKKKKSCARLVLPFVPMRAPSAVLLLYFLLTPFQWSLSGMHPLSHHSPTCNLVDYIPH
jgi:hypothetical protein